MIPMGAGITLQSGAHFNYTDPGATLVSIEDIAHALSHVCRFAGHTNHFYPVALHCVNASYIVDEPFAYCALMHDTAEAFTNDIPTPLKFAVPLFKDLETLIETEMAKQFGFEFPLPPEVKQADLEMLVLENHYVRRGEPLSGIDMDSVPIDHWHGLVDIGVLHFGQVSPNRAKHLFLERYEELKPND